MTEIDPAKGEKPVYFFDIEEDWERQQMACELMDFREQTRDLTLIIEKMTEDRNYWRDKYFKMSVDVTKVVKNRIKDEFYSAKQWFEGI